MKIFLSYRRGDSAQVTGRLYDNLLAAYGKGSVFKDVDSIPSGSDFRKSLEDSVGHADVLLAVISKTWLTAVDEKGQFRLQDPSDFVRREIETALKNKIKVVPVVIDGAALPRAEQLPDTLRELAYRQAAPLRPDPDFHSDIQRLIRSISPHLRKKKIVLGALVLISLCGSSVFIVKQFLVNPTTAIENKTLLDRAQDYFNREYYGIALKEAEDLIKRDPGNAGAYKIAGAASFKQGEFPSALRMFEKSLEIDPKFTAAIFGKGATLIALGDFSGGKKMFEILRDSEPTDMDVRYNLALANLLSLDHNGARENYGIIYDRGQGSLRAKAALGLGINELLNRNTKESHSRGIHYFHEAVCLLPTLQGVFLGSLKEDKDERYGPYINLLTQFRGMEIYESFLVRLREGKPC